MTPDAHPYRSPPPRLCAPPRHVPVSVRVMLPFGGSIAVFGWLFFIIGSVIAWALVPNADLSAPYCLFLPTETAPAEVTVVDRTGAKVNGRRIYAVAFHFTLDGETHSARSYMANPPPVGAEVMAEVPRGHAHRARLVGSARAPMPFWCVPLVLLFPAIGLGFIVSACKRGLDVARLLRDGEVARGKLVDKTPTGAVINNRPVYALRFAFEAADGSKHFAVARTDQPAPLEDEPTEQLVYLPGDPDVASMIDHLPGDPRIHDDGTIAPASLVTVARVLALPVVGVAVTVIGALAALG